MITYLKLVWAYLKIGLFGFGGGYAMLSLIKRIVVDSGWISDTVFTDIVAVSQMTPGPIGINSATYIGYTITGNVVGSVLATLAVVMPSFLLVIFANRYIMRHRDSLAIRGIFLGLRYVVVGMIASAALLLTNRENFIDNTWSIAIFASAFTLVYFVKLHPIYVIILAGVAGYIIY